MSRKSLIAAPALLAACTGGITQRDAEDQLVHATATGGQCLNIAQAEQFRFLAADQLIVYAPRNQPWHVELISDCREVPRRTRITLHSRTSELCGVAGDEIVVRGEFRERCQVLRVTRVRFGEIGELIDRHSDRPRAAGEFEVVIPQRDE